MGAFDENALIAHLNHRSPPIPAGGLGIGDDCCIWPSGPQTCLSVDAIVEGRHFTSDSDPLAVGGKAALAALSDLAAMAARPVGAAVSLVCPARWDGRQIMDGLVAALERYDCPWFGGDTTGGDQLVVSVTVWGEPAGERLLRRSQAEVGDLLVVTGRLGGSFASGRHLCPTPRLAEGAWLGSRDFVHGLMDLSDGLAADAPKLAEASSCGCLLLPGDLPLHADVDLDGDPFGQALCDGEDYELLMAVAAEHWPALQMAWPFDCELTRVGWLLAEPGSFIENQIGRIVPSPYEGFVHRA